ncbi:MAG: hypothetical protein NC827_01335 [Candidatus Omnitrophica bacterium]|nr:hypothetical protein [Candidatus Omnitrophota bacterium]MCM8801943.1 hypothetical protein [Candidatus Omnitrophota bacterium]
METKILVDSSKIVHYSRCEKGIFSAIEHLGFYYKIIDLSFERFFEREIENTNLIVIGQEGLGFSLGKLETDILIKNLYSGVGIVIFDGYISSYPFDFLKNIKIEEFIPKRTSKIKLEKNSWICQGTYNDEFELKNEIIFYSVKFDNRAWKVFLYNEDGQPCGIYGRFGKGKIVLFLTSAGLWQDDVLGHTEGLDDVFFRSLIWASKKPFITKTMPPFITARIDDVSGSGSKVVKYKETVERFKYVDILNRYKIVPNLGLFIDDIEKDDILSIREKYFEKQAEFSPHAFSDPVNKNEYPIYMKHNGQEFSDNELKENFNRVDIKFELFGIKPSITLNAHFGEVGIKSLSYLKERNQNFLMNIIRVGKAYSDPKSHIWDLKPYNKINFSLSEIPEDNDFFNVLSLPLKIEEKSSNEKNPDFDFLYKCTNFWNENNSTDTKRAIKRGIFQIKRGLENKFFGCLMTHEQRISFLKIEEWEEIIKGIINSIGMKNKIFKNYDYISLYAKNLKSISIEKIDFDKNLEIILKGGTKINLYLYIFYDRDDEVIENFLEIPPFESYTKLNFKIQG